MSRRKTPTNRFHRSSGRAIVTYYDANGQRRAIFPPGPFNSKRSVLEYQRILAILKANGEREDVALSSVPAQDFAPRA